MPIGKSCYVLIRYIVIIGALNFEFGLQSRPYAVQNTLWNATGKQRRDLRHRWQFAFSVEESVLDFAEQILRQIEGELPPVAEIAPLFTGRVPEGVLYCVRAALQSEFEI